jgi:hypothetical protein
MRVDETLDWTYENENRMVFQSEFDEVYLKKRIESFYKQFSDNRDSARALATLPERRYK